MSDRPSARAERLFAAEVAALALDRPAHVRMIHEADLAHLPATARRYFHFMGVCERPRELSFRVAFRGRFRMAPDGPWMSCSALQFDGLDDHDAVARLFHMRLTLHRLLPTLVRDTYVEGHGRMLGKLFDLLPVVDATGPELDLGELVTYLNDAILFAPSMLLGPECRFTEVDDRSFDVALRDRGLTVRARVFVDENGAPRDFSTEDRYVADPYTQGHPLVRARWSTPIDGWSDRSGRPVFTRGHAVWHLPGGAFEYADLEVVEGSLAFSPAWG